MEVLEVPPAEEVAALRRRLYRPDPPADAVAAYLEALGRLPSESSPAPAPTPPTPRRRSRRAAAAVLVLAAVVALGSLAAALRSVPAAPAPPVTRSAATGYPPVPGTVVGRMSGGPKATRTFDAGSRAVVVSVLCDGDGTIALRIGLDPETVLVCQAGPPALAMIPSVGPLGPFSVAVTPSGGVRWSASAGAVDPAG